MSEGAAEGPKVVLYLSSVATTAKIRADTQVVKSLLSAHGVAFEEVGVKSPVKAMPSRSGPCWGEANVFGSREGGRLHVCCGQGAGAVHCHAPDISCCGPCGTAPLQGRSSLRMHTMNSQVDLIQEPGRREEMLAASGGHRLLPQVHVGGKVSQGSVCCI